jgi:hypothetical protein
VSWFRCNSTGGIGNERRAFTPSAIRKLLINALAATRLAYINGDPLMFQVTISEESLSRTPFERPTALHRAGHLRARNHRHDRGLHSRLSRRDN